MPVVLKKSGQYPKHPKICNQAKRYAEKYAALIGLDDSWTIYIAFQSLKKDGDVVAECSAEWHYRLVNLTLDIIKIRRKAKVDMEAVIRHELLHVPCWRIHELVNALVPDKEELISKYEEELVTFLENMPVWKGKEEE